jgi:N-acetylmuramoyl-L-alanine amidase
MSLSFRAALAMSIAASVLGLAAPITAVQAAELAHVALSASAVDPINAPESVPVPVQSPAPTSAAVETTGADLQPGDEVAYPTLAAAVAAQDVDAAGDEQLRCLATSIYFESKGEPLAGQLAVAQVVLNRAKQKRFGASVCGVVTQPGQFSFVRGGELPDVDESKATYRTAVAVAKVAMAEAWDSPAPDALYFNARRAPFAGKTRVASIGNHVFYR